MRSNRGSTVIDQKRSAKLILRMRSNEFMNPTNDHSLMDESSSFSNDSVLFLLCLWMLLRSNLVEYDHLTDVYIC